MNSHALLTTVTRTDRQMKGEKGRNWVEGVGTKPSTPLYTGCAICSNGEVSVPLFGP